VKEKNRKNEFEEHLAPIRTIKHSSDAMLVDSTAQTIVNYVHVHWNGSQATSNVTEEKIKTYTHTHTHTHTQLRAHA
jgi:hypothetical protein